MSTPTLTRPVVPDPSTWKNLPTTVRVSDLVSRSSVAACQLKEAGCAQREHHDIAPVVEFFKNDQLILALFPNKISRDNALICAQITASAIQPDVICVTMDAHVSQEMINPSTGKEWGPGEMQASCDDEGACATGLLTDCLVTMAVFKDGHHEMLQRRYRGHEGIGTLEWIGEGDHFVLGKSEGHTMGLVQDSLVRSMELAWSEDSAMARVEQQLSEKATKEGISEHLQFWHRVVSGAKLALYSGAAGGCLVNAPDTEIRDMVQCTMSQEAMVADRDDVLGLMGSLLAIKMGVE